MQTEPLLAHLASRFVSQRENLATEALAYILTRSRIARTATIRTFRLVGADLDDDLRFRTQAVESDGGIPDLVGEDANHVQRLLIEAKFWAGLTSHQPVTYLRRIEAQEGGTLAFLVPEQRAELVWDEILRRCSSADLAVAEGSGTSPGTHCAVVKPATCLCLITWRGLLSNILSEVESAGDHLIASDVRQLQGLCEREDAEAFLPLTSEEVTGGTVPKRIVQYSNLVDDLTNRLVTLGLADLKGLKASAGKGWYGRYLRIHNVGCLLQFSASNWAEKSLTPIWLNVTSPTWTHDARIVAHLVQRSSPGGAFENPKGVTMAIHLPVGVEREQVFEAAVMQLTRIAQSLNELAAFQRVTEVAVPSVDLEEESQDQILSGPSTHSV